ncbi:MAG: amidohydrolase family protein [Opitutaceae bacterium]|nr:amidohydrolase family protein [Opitutaceae bacterium]
MKTVRSFAPAVASFTLLAVSVTLVAAPAPTAPIEGLRDASVRVHALVGARIVAAPDRVIESGTVVVRDGIIVAVGADVTAPADARVWDVTGRTIYAGLIETDSTLFLPVNWKPASPAATDSERESTPVPGTAAAPAAVAAPGGGAKAWNSRVMPERMASRALVADPRGAEAMRKLGFTVAHVLPARGIFRGQSAVVSLGRGGFNRTLLRDSVAQPVAFERGSSEAGYPVSLMGAIALTRQTLLDAQWYAGAQQRYRENRAGIERPETNDALAALGPAIRGEQPVILALADELDLPRAARLGGEFKLKLILRGTGYEYRVLRDLPAGRPPIIVPLAFPEPPEVENSEHAADISLDKLTHWELAPGNPARLVAAGLPVALTASGLKKPDTEFWSRVRLAVQRGLGVPAALGALTTTPAEILGLGVTHGTITAGKVANLVVARGDLFTAEDSEVQLVWIDGDPFELDSWRRRDPRGSWKLTWQGATTAPDEMKITGRGNRLRASAAGTDTALRVEENTVALLAPAQWFGLAEGTVRLGARLEDPSHLNGTGELPDGTALRWRAERTAEAEPPRAPAAKKPETLVARPDVFPAGMYGRSGPPERPVSVLVRNATVWTSAAAGTIEHCDLLIENGRIVGVGPSLAAPPDAVVIDATGRHVSPGLIDCHSHTALNGGVNEGSHSVTVEVRVGDAVDPTDIGIYRELAGGLTVANILHGSANSMGGQNQVIKLRWGESAEGLKFIGAPPGVKFALGENVTRKNQTAAPTRYPASRMGVREIMLDTFTRARDYERAWAGSRSNPAAPPPRRDLRLEAALEILHGERLIHIHSYRQDEVLAFIRLAQQLQLPVATFQHILEGYKVADQIAAIGAGGSCFADWWAYKYEVVDAIPYGGALMHAAGVVVSFNSDNNELARHLNTEAAKAVKYGGISPAEALKFVTLNPAKQLRIDRHVGSLERGKDADFVIWTASPLSTYSRVEQTWIDGRRYFDRDDDARQRAAAAAQRAALIQKILPERQKALVSGAGATAREGGAADDAKPVVLRIIEAMATAHAVEARPLYHDGGSVDNCTTEGGIH